MTTLTQFPARQAVIGFAAGALFMALVSLVGTAIAQTPTPTAPDLLPMLEWCRQMMGSVDIQGMLEACRGMMGQAGAMMQGMVSGMCMMGREVPRRE
jgi:hypothetical protein